ncbi:DUF305 domain-containing protein [Paractinoplanes rishiriensis]|uniref:DUF305 domain-containing protein n=1 Tax=Paractinoplanes rishiriensis TaxID=1050105 RepID=A0A919JWW7_9ACTN|nr:DUF305 domain-containing protein [Actinoplanes rishiriensis]GIE94759.1 hypothetical protein Ari01nite_22240 [Actinoplanes rishiriensis]
MARRLALRVALSLLLVSGCSARPETSAPAAAYNAADVMYLQMGLAQIAEGEPVLALAEERAGEPRLRELVTELRGQWGEESGTMRRWLLGWQQPLTADPSAAHDGHGALHALRPADVAELRAAADFDRTAVNLLLGHLGNGVETARMGSASGSYPPARALADSQAQRRQAQIQRLLALAFP